MHIFITGIRGFMGSHLANYLWKQGHTVTGIDNDFHSCENPLSKSWCCFDKDIRDKKWLEKYFKAPHFQPIDMVIHLAAQIHVDYSIKHPIETMDINVGGTINILEECRKHNIKCIVASTSEAYGSSQSVMMDEKHPLDCQSPYGASKVAADRMAKSYTDTYGMEIVIIRNFNAFGPYQNDGSYGSVIARFTKAAIEGEMINIYGSGDQERDYMYIDDIIKAYEFAMDLPSGVYNFGTGETQTISRIANRIKVHTDSESQIMHVEARAGEVQRLCCDITKARSHGFEPSTVFDRDLLRYINWYKERVNG